MLIVVRYITDDNWDLIFIVKQSKYTNALITMEYFFLEHLILYVLEIVMIMQQQWVKRSGVTNLIFPFRRIFTVTGCDYYYYCRRDLKIYFCSFPFFLFHLNLMGQIIEKLRTNELSSKLRKKSLLFLFCALTDLIKSQNLQCLKLDNLIVLNLCQVLSIYRLSYQRCTWYSPIDVMFVKIYRPSHYFNT